MKRLTYLLCFFLPVLVVKAQPESLYQVANRPRVQVTVFPTYQSYTFDGSKLNELSIPLWAVVPVSRSASFSVMTHTASISGDDVENVSGLSDVQLAYSQQFRMGGGSVVFNLGANLPSGKKELSLEEYATSVLLSQYVYDFRVPVLGQGLNLSPGITWAYPVGNGLVIGLGAAYQYVGAFTPVEGLDDYDPGDEIMAVAGLETRITPGWSLGGDVAYTYYGADKIGDFEPLSSGNRITATLQLLGRPGFDTIRLLARYRNKAKSDLPAVSGLADASLQTVPTVAEIRGSYRRRFSPATHVTLLARGRMFGETDLCSGTDTLCDSQTTFDVGIEPELMITPGVSLLARGLFRTGSLSGFEAGAGLVIQP